MTSIKRVHDYLFHVTVAIIIFIIGVWIVFSMIPKSSFESSNYLDKQEAFKTCLQNEELMLTTQEFNTTLFDQSLESISAKVSELKQSHGCDSSHVISSYKQVQTMALKVVDYAKEYFHDDVKVVNAVYTTPSSIAALLDQPQAYLFFVSNSDQTKIVAITVYELNNKAVISPLWDIDKSGNLDYTQAQVQKLLLWFSEIKK